MLYRKLDRYTGASKCVGQNSQYESVLKSRCITLCDNKTDKSGILRAGIYKVASDIVYEGHFYAK